MRSRFAVGPSVLLIIAALALVVPEAQSQTPTAASGGEGEPSQTPQRPRTWSERLEFATPDKAFSIGPTGNIHFDAASVFGPEGPEVGPRARTSLRRARVGIAGKLFEDFEYSFVWNFAGIPDETGDLSRVALAYVGLKPFRFAVGAYEPRFTLDDSQSSNDLLFLERATVVNAASSLAGGSGRLAAGVEVLGERWFGGAYMTGGSANVSGDERQRGAQVRLVGTPLNTGTAVLHLGISASWVFRPSLSAGRRAVEFEEEPELRPGVQALLEINELTARRARTQGVELGFSWGRFWTQGEYHQILVDRPDGLSRAEFDGWYGQVAYLLAGKPRTWEGNRGAWVRPRPAGAFDPRAGEWGAVEAGLRYSRFDLNHRDMRGGRQAVWTAGLSWYPRDDLKFMAQYQVGEVTPEGQDRALRFQAVGVRVQTTF